MLGEVSIIDHVPSLYQDHTLSKIEIDTPGVKYHEKDK